jgi:manganese oxidase
MNYRSEPLPLRVASTSSHDPNVPAQDLALGYASIPRELASLNTQPPNTQKLFPTDPTSDVKYPGGFVGAESLDPYTPLLRAYANDRVQVRVLVGAHELNHTFAMHGAKWLFEPSDTNSGLVAAQPMGISEHFEMLFTLPPAGRGDQSDYLYQTDANLVAQEDGLWGLLRSYNTSRPDLPPLPNNPPRATATTKACPDDAHHVRFSITAVTAARALPAGGLTYNDRIAGFPLTQPDGILYVPSGNLDASGKLLPGAPIEPLILRAAAGNCIDVTLTNLLDPSETDSNNQPIFNSPTPDQYPGAGMPPIGIFPSARAGLHAQLLEADVTTSDGTRIGKNPDQTAAPKGGTVQYTWYAGKRDSNRFVPAELGVVNLQSADPIEQTLVGAVGALVIEPPAATWSADFGTEAAATVFPPHDPAFREFVGVWQPGINGLGAWQAGSNVFPIGEGLNYRSEPFPLRIATADISNVWSDTAVSPPGPPQTPISSAASGMPVRFRFVNPGGTSPAGNVSITLAEIFGHHWQEEPWRDHSTLIGRNQDSQSMGGAILGSSHALNLVIDHAGAPGDHLYRNFIASPTFNYAMWGLFRVGPPATDVVVVTAYQPTSSGGATVSGYVTTDLRTRHYAMGVQLVGRVDHAPVDQATGAFQLALADQPQSVTVRSANGGEASATLPPVAPAVAATPLATARIARALAAPARSARLEQIANQTAKYFPRPVNQRPPAR